MLNTATVPVIDSILMEESPEDAAALRPLLLQIRATADRKPPAPSAAIQRLLDGDSQGNVVQMGDFLARREAKGQGRYGVKRRLAVTSVAAVLMLGAGTGVAAAMDDDLYTDISQNVARVQAAVLPHVVPIPGPPAAIDSPATPDAETASTVPTTVASTPAPAAPPAAPAAPEAPATPPASTEAPEAPAATDGDPGKSDDSQGNDGARAKGTGTDGTAADQGDGRGAGVLSVNGNGNGQGNGNGNAWGRGKNENTTQSPAAQPAHEDILGELLGKMKKAKKNH